MNLVGEAVVDFAQECASTYFQTLPPDIILEKAVDFVEKTDMQSRVFKVKNPQGQLLFVIKIYPSERFDLTVIEHLASPHGLLGRLRLQQSVIPFPLAVRECIEARGLYYLIAFPAAAGHSLWFYLENKNLPILQKAMQKVALSLAELHLQALNPAGEISPAYELQEQHALRFFQKWMDRPPKAFPVKGEPVTQKFYQLRADMLTSPSLTGWIHGDAMLHHFFYEAERNFITMIDLDRCIFAILANKRMGGPFAYDYAFAVNSLWQLGIYAGWEPHTLQQLQKEFTEIYQTRMGRFFPSEPSIRYYSFIYCLKKACLTSKRLELFSPETPIFKKLNHTLHYLVNTL
ncbi:aminoglycoside phosphotransferase family protein [Parachlamydia sp. AcF125]|uniref:aminoglycoside phosphotransferase family protein n=1 Tax=Parachlamydia sp. AcF125 TaxID=2795736 RepID=UPI001BCA3622|nr:aminoglycoside phosphotransferase family protein [Parachlamydia sp. AcF125]MBS4168656.1 hypothetical protein [Parachlamydia sp. AcF125]